MFILGGLKTYLVGGALALLLLVGGGLVYYVKSMQKDLAHYQTEARVLGNAYEASKNRIDQLKERVRLQSIANEKLAHDLAEAREPAKAMEKLFSDHDMETLVEKKPGLMQNKMRRATDEMYRQLEQATR